MGSFVDPDWMTPTEVVESIGKALFPDEWPGKALPTVVELLEGDGQGVLAPDWRVDIRRSRAGYRAVPPERVRYQLLLELLEDQKEQEPEKAELRTKVFDIVRTPLLRGEIRWAVIGPTGHPSYGEPDFWRTHYAQFEIGEAIVGPVVQTASHGPLIQNAVTGRMVLNRHDVAAWLASLEAPAAETEHVEGPTEGAPAAVAEDATRDEEARLRPGARGNGTDAQQEADEPPAEVVAVQGKTKRQNKGGRPTIVYRDEVINKAVEWLKDEGRQDQSEVIKYMSQTIAKIDREGGPSHSTMKNWAKKALEEFERYLLALGK
jgi:hypothetical protein